MARSSPKPSLPTFDELFTTQEERDDLAREKVKDILLSEIDPFPDHPYQVRIDDEMRDLAESIREYGVLTPAIARPKEDGRYELVSGHRRMKASELAGVATLPVIVRDMDRDAATVLMVNANMQREVVLPSEKAHAYRMKLEAIKRQGARTDLTCAPVAHKLGIKSRDIIAEESGESKDQIRRYIRLTSLIPEVLAMVDESKIALRPAVELSYLKEGEQRALLDTMALELATPSHVQAMKLRKFSEDGKLTPEVTLSIMQEAKPNQVEHFKIPRDKIDRFFKPGMSAAEKQDTVIKALELYRKRERSRAHER